MATSTTPQPYTADRPENSTTSVDANVTVCRDRYPKASDTSSPPCLLRLLPAGANRRVGLAPTGKAPPWHGAHGQRSLRCGPIRLVTGSRPRPSACEDVKLLQRCSPVRPARKTPLSV